MLLDDQYKAPPARLADNGRTTCAATIVCKRTVQPSAVDEPVRVPSPSVAGFKEWLKRQPREGTFDYYAFCGCAADQYCKSVGTSWEGFNNRDPLLLGSIDDFAYNANLKAYHEGRLPTFGDVLAEIEKAGL